MRDVWLKSLAASAVFAIIVSAMSTIGTAMAIMYVAMYPGPRASQIPNGGAVSETAKAGTFRSNLTFNKAGDGTWTGHCPWWYGPFRHESLRFNRLTITAVGWPFPCMYGGSAIGSLDSYDGSGFYSFGYIQISSTRYRNGFGGVVPTRFAFFGFIANVAIFAAPLFALIHCVRVAARLRRSRQGRCPMCGYPMGNSRCCSECGAGDSAGRPAT